MIRSAMYEGSARRGLGTPRNVSQHGRYGKCCKKRRKSSDDWPDGEREERRALAVRFSKEPMNVCCECEAEGPQSDRPGCMQRRRTRRTAQSIVLVPDVRRGHGGAGQPRCQPPQAHMIGVSRERSKNDTDGPIRHRNKNHRTEPQAAT